MSPASVLKRAIGKLQSAYSLGRSCELSIEETRALLDHLHELGSRG